MAKDDIFQRAKERIDEAKELARDQHERIREDLRFSNPAKPEQWSQSAIGDRTGRPTLTLDRTNQFISQVVNDARQNNPGIQVIGVDDKADPKVAETLSGIIRHIEYQSRASQAYDYAIEMGARVGLGWLRVVPEVVDDVTNEQDVRIMRVVDATSCGLDPNSIEPDGRDATWGYAETRIHERTFKAQYPKAKAVTFADAGWYSDGFITLCEYFELTEQKVNKIVAINAEGFQEVFTEEEYWRAAESFGQPFQVVRTATATERKVKWIKMTGAEVLEETEFPSQYIPIVPVLGYELWVDGRRYLCGLTRRLMDGQRLHNYQMSALAEFLSSQPKAPFIVPAEGVEGWEGEWKKLNKGNPAFLPYNSVTDEGQQIPAPSRVAPPPMPGAYAQLAQFATEEMQAAVGMYKANLGQQGNETSGRAIRARQMEGDTATFHFIDNLSRTIEQVGRIVIDMIPRLWDTERIKQVLGIDGARKAVTIKPNMPQAAKVDEKGKVIAINPNVGKYDVRVQAGPSYTTQREETAQQLADMIQAQPNLAPVLGPMWVRMRDMPEADKIARLLLAMAPPQVQALESDEEIPPAAAAKLQQMQQQMQEMQAVIEQANQHIAAMDLEREKMTLDYLAKAAQIEADEYAKQTDRMKVMAPAFDANQVAAIAAQLVMQSMQREPLQGGEELEDQVQDLAGLPDDEPYGGPNGAPPGLHEEPEPMGEQEPPEPTEPQENEQQPPHGGFFAPGEGGEMQ